MEKKDRYEEYAVLQGFKFLEMYETPVIGEPGEYVTVLRFYNENHVMIDLTVINGEFQMGEPYAVNDDFERSK